MKATSGCRAPVAAVAAGILLSGCGSEDAATCRKPGERYPERATTIEAAREREGELVGVRGALIARDGRPWKLCTSLSDERPPDCREPSLEVEGLRDTTAFEGGESEGEVSWWESASIGGRIDGDTIRFEISCRAREVQEHLGDEIGEEPGFNAFASNAGVERLDYAPLPGMMPRELRAKYGWFGVSVATDERPEPLFAAEIRDRGAKQSDGVYWLRENRKWFALRRYGDDIALVWLAGATRRLDERFQRVDAIMRELESR